MKKLEEIKLKQDPYPTGGSFPTLEGTFCGNWYEAAAEDENGNDFMIYWTDVDWDIEDESDACDWNNPDYIREI